MLLKLSEYINDAETRASECGERATRCNRRDLQAEWLHLQRTWVRVAEAFRVVESLERFVLDKNGYQTRIADIGASRSPKEAMD
jgi:hypothetical protein